MIGGPVAQPYVTFGVAIAVAAATPGSLRSQQIDPDEGDKVLQGALVVTAAASIVMVGIVDMFTAASSARRTNEARIGLAPIADVRERRVGLGMSVPLGSGGSAGRHVVAGVRSSARQGQGRPKSPGTATAWSLGATLVPAFVGGAILVAGGGNDNQTTAAIGGTMLGAGWLVGPSAGHWYAEQHGRGWLTTGIRFGLSLLGFAALAALDFD
jgi:hypothetical protein